MIWPVLPRFGFVLLLAGLLTVALTRAAPASAVPGVVAPSLLDVLQRWWWAVVGPGAFGFGILILYLRSQFVPGSEFRKQSEHVNKALAGLEERLDGLASRTERRLQQLETATEHLPTKDAFHALALHVERQGTEITALRDTQRATAEGVKRIEEFLISQGTKR